MVRRVTEVVRALIGAHAVAGVAAEAVVVVMMVVVVGPGLGSGHVGLIAVIREAEAVAVVDVVNLSLVVADDAAKIS